jgi:hypothetical protein
MSSACKNTLIYLAAAMLFGACGAVVANDPDADPGDLADADLSTPDAFAPDANPCDTATCECDTDDECGAHEYCDTSGPGRVCACVAGYTGSPCAWGGAPADPGFQDGTAWSVTGGAAISPLSSGSVDPGEMILNPTAQCNMGQASQIFEMPPYDKAEPFVAEVTYQILGGDPYENTSASVGFNRAWRDLPRATTGWRTERICLGEAAYGGPVDFRASTNVPSYLCGGTPTTTIAVDHLAVKVADENECPVPGTALNGDAEGDYGWVFTSSQSSTAGFVDGAGSNGSRAARFNLRERCSGVSMTAMISVPTPESTPSPALEFWWTGRNGVNFSMSASGESAVTLAGTGTAQTARYCLPPRTHGSVTTLRFTVGGGSGLCSDILDYDLSVDDVRIVSDPSCGDATDLLDPGFESAPAPLLHASVSSPAWQQVNNLSNATLARSGSGVLEFVQQTFCNNSSYTNWLYVPRPVADAGPAVKFWSNVPANAATTARYSGPAGSANLPTGGGWQLNTVCLPSNWIGRWLPFAVGVSGGSGQCNTNSGNIDRFYFDDFEVTTDSSCAP